jgi:hypothetical protein
MQNGTEVRAGQMSLAQAEEEYNATLSRLTGEQYELLPPPPSDSDAEIAQAPLFVIRHVLRENVAVAPVLGIYYVLEGVIYKSPSMRTLMKSNIARTCKGLEDACDVLSNSARGIPRHRGTFLILKQGRHLWRRRKMRWISWNG